MAFVRTRRFRRGFFTPYLYLIPVLIPMAVFLYWPLIYNILLSMTDWNFIRPTMKFVKLHNFQELFRRKEFLKAAYQSLFYYLGLLPFQLFLPLLLAIATANIRSARLATAYKVLTFSPTVLSFAIACIVWIWMLNPIGGVVNRALVFFGLPNISWMREVYPARMAIVFVSGWKTFGYYMVIFTAALMQIPDSYLEAALIDGASPSQVFWRIKWPLITPTTFYVLITSSLYAATQLITPIQVLTEGGPVDSTINLAYFIYKMGFHFFNVGVSSAGAIVTFIVFMLITLLQFRIMERYVYYEK